MAFSLYATAGVLVPLAIALFARLVSGSWLAPGAFFAGIWALMLIPAALWPPVQLGFLTIGVISAFVVMVLIGALISRMAWRGRRSNWYRVHGGGETHSSSHLARGWRTSRLRWIVTGLGLGGLTADYMYVTGAGYSLLQLADFDTWLSLAVHYSVERYLGGYVEPVALRLLLALNYTGAALSGFLFRRDKSAIGLVASLLPIVAAGIVTLLTTAKAPLLISSTLLLGSWLVSGLISGLQGDQRRDNRGPATLIALGTIVTIAAIVSLIFRVSYSDSESVWDILILQLEAYALGHIAAFNLWIQTESWLFETPTWGALTVSGLFDAAGISARTQGVYEVLAFEGLASESNVFTAFRGLISDFTSAGALLVSLLAGFLAGHTYEKVRCGRSGPVSVCVLLFFYSAALWSPIGSLFAYNVIVFSFVFTAVLLSLCWDRVGATSMPRGDSTLNVSMERS